MSCEIMSCISLDVTEYFLSISVKVLSFGSQTLNLDLALLLVIEKLLAQVLDFSAMDNKLFLLQENYGSNSR